jgi:hypothetical protein
MILIKFLQAKVCFTQQLGIPEETVKLRRGRTIFLRSN